MRHRFGRRAGLAIVSAAVLLSAALPTVAQETPPVAGQVGEPGYSEDATYRG
jgi:hypothetical protein